MYNYWFHYLKKKYLFCKISFMGCVLYSTTKICILWSSKFLFCIFKPKSVSQREEFCISTGKGWHPCTSDTMLFAFTLFISGNTYIGLLQTCVTIYGRPTHCFTPDHIRGEWMFTFLCIVLGIIFVTVTIVLLAVSYWKYEVMKYARWLGFAASELK